MKVNGYIRIPTEVDLKPGDKCEIIYNHIKLPYITVRKIVEDNSGVKVNFTNGTWRPIRTHGITWQKVMG